MTPAIAIIKVLPVVVAAVLLVLDGLLYLVTIHPYLKRDGRRENQ